MPAEPLLHAPVRRALRRPLHHHLPLPFLPLLLRHRRHRRQRPKQPNAPAPRAAANPTALAVAVAVAGVGVIRMDARLGQKVVEDVVQVLGRLGLVLLCQGGQWAVGWWG